MSKAFKYPEHCDVRAVVWFIKAIEPHPFLLRFIVKMWWQNAEVVKKWVWQLNERWLKVNDNNRKKSEKLGLTCDNFGSLVIIIRRLIIEVSFYLQKWTDNNKQYHCCH